MTAVRAPWTSVSFLLYAGAFTVLVGVAWLLNVLADDFGDGALVGWSGLIFAGLALLAAGFRQARFPVAAGLFAFCAVVAFVLFFGTLENSLVGFPDADASPFDGFRWEVLLLEVLTAAAAGVALRVFRFPLLVTILLAALWLFVTDLVSNGGDWSAAVTIVFGLLLLAVAIMLDGVPARQYGLWVHVAAAVAIGGGFLYFSHDTKTDWVLVGIAGLIYIAAAERLARSSWAVLGAWGLLQTATYFAQDWAGEDFFALYFFFPFFFVAPFAGDSFSGENSGHEWAAPLLYVALGLGYVLIALVLARIRRRPDAALAGGTPNLD
jgi:hypothetical protein